ncbi:MAG: insulinase family protein [Bacteroidetes bacterium]|nr:insulinase family protein [Bacteroidota bacterium]
MKNKIKNYNKTELDNGLVVASEFVPVVGSFAAGVSISVGSRDDYKNKEGIAHFMEHSAFRHTKNRTAKQIANEFENIGAYSNAWTTKDITCYYVRAITNNFNKAFELLSDISLNTIFIENEINKERSIIIEEIKSYEDDPEENILDLIDSLVFSNNPMSHSITGTQQSVSNILLADLEAFQKQFYQPSNMLISVAGNIEHDKVVELTEKLFNTQNTNDKTKNTNKYIQKHKDINNELIVNKPIQQAHIMLAHTIKKFKNPKELYKLAIANIIFGDGMSSRLYQVLREKYGLAYSVSSSYQTYISSCGQINIYSATDKTNIEKTTDLIYQQMTLLNNSKKPTEKELKRAKEQLKTATIIEMESMASKIHNIIKYELYFGYRADINDIINDVENITLDDIVEINAKYLLPDNWHKCVLMPEESGK